MTFMVQQVCTAGRNGNYTSKMSCHFRCSEKAIFGNEKPAIVALPDREMSVMDMSDATVETMNSVVGMFGAGLWIFVSVDKLQA